MPSKKKAIASLERRRRRVKANSPVTLDWTLGLPGEGRSANGKNREYQRIKNPQTREEREKWLAKKEALTLRAFQIAYENYHQRKSS